MKTLMSLFVCGSILCALPWAGDAEISEPYNVFYGPAREGVQTVTAKVHETVVASYTMGSHPTLDPGLYLLTIPIDAVSPSVEGAAQVGDLVDLYFDEETRPFVFGIPIEERGRVVNIGAMDLISETRVLWTKPGTGMASVWTITSGLVMEGTPFQKPVSPEGWLATSYAPLPGGNYEVLWALPGTGKANLWRMNGQTGQKIDGFPFTKPIDPEGFTATAHWPNYDGTFKLVWSRETDGKVNVWTVDSSSGAKLSGFPFQKPIDPVNWQALSYAPREDLTGDAIPEFELLWSQRGTGQMNLWTVNGATGDKIAGLPLTKSGDPIGWTARTHWPNGDGTCDVVWSHESSGTANIWTVDRVSGAKISGFPLNKTLDPATWIVTGYVKPSSLTLAMANDVESGAITIRKQGSGQGMITSGAQVCDAACGELRVPYVTDGSILLHVTAEPGSRFLGWTAEDGTPIAGVHYAQPGETVYAVFEQP